MPLSKKAKEGLYEGMVERFQKTGLALFAAYKGLPSTEVFEARKKIKSERAHLQLVKNSLLKRAFERLGIAAGDPGFWKGETAILLGPNGDASQIAKILAEWMKTNQKVAIKGGFLALSKKWLTQKEVLTLAALPGIRDLRAQAVGALAAPLSGLAATAQAVLARFLLTLKAIEGAQGGNKNAG